MDKFCYSCAAPLGMPEFKGAAENYCKNCTDDKGNLNPKEAVQNNIAGWFKTWQPDLSDQSAQIRAGIYLQSMPAWAEK